MKIVASYQTYSEWNIDEILEDYGIISSDVIDYWVKWDTLHIMYFNPRTEVEEVLTAHPHISARDSDFMRPDEVIEQYQN